MFDIKKIRKIRLMCLAVAALAVFGIGAGSAGAITPPTPHFTFVIGSSWSPTEKAQLESWLNPGGPVMQTIKQVYGPPHENLTIEVVKESSGWAGEYNASSNRMTEASLSLPVTVHELNHATRDNWDLLQQSVWEEGLARAGEKEVMRLLKLQGVTEEGYDTNHEYGYAEYYENNNVLAVGVPHNNIRAEAALTLLRYEQAGYAISKIMMEDPQFQAQFNAKLFTHSNTNLSSAELVAMAAGIQPTVERQPFAAWIQQQYIFDGYAEPGCHLFIRSNQNTVDDFIIDQYGNVTMQQGALIELKITNAANAVLFRGSNTTSEYGWAGFEPPMSPTAGRIKMVASAPCPLGGTVKTTFYRQASNPEGVFGVVTNANTGTVSFSSPNGQFAPLSIPVSNGAFTAAALTSIRGQVLAQFSGEGKAATRTFNKDAAPYSLVLTATKVRKSNF